MDNGVGAAGSATDVVEIGTTPYTAYVDAANGYVRSWNGTNWSTVGSPLTSATAVLDIRLLNAGGTLYAAVHWMDDTADTTTYVGLYRWNGASWVQVYVDSRTNDHATLDESLAQPRLAFDGTLVWLSYTAYHAVPLPSVASVFAVSATAADVVTPYTVLSTNDTLGGSALAVNAGAPELSVLDSTTASMRSFTFAGAFSETSALAASVTPVDAASYAGNYVVLVNAGGALTVRSLSAGTWSTLGGQVNTAGETASAGELFAWSGSLYVAYSETTSGGVPYRIGASVWAGASWSSEGSPLNVNPAISSTVAGLYVDANGRRIGLAEGGHAYEKAAAFCPSPNPCAPSNLAPAAWAPAIPTLQSSAFSDADGDTHAASQWQVRTNIGNYLTPVEDSGTTATALTSYTMSTTLTDGQVYWFHVRHRDSAGNWSAWSTETSFTVDTVLPTGGTISHTDGVTQAPPQVTFTPGSDAASGLDLANAHLQRDSAAYVAGSCQPFGGAWADVGPANPTSVYTDLLTVDNTCYRYRYRVPDVAGNVQAYVTSPTQTAIKVPDTTPPTGGTLDYPNTTVYANFQVTFTAGSDAESGINASATQLQVDTVAYVLGSGCVFPGTWSNAGAAGGASPYTQAITVGNCYRYRLLVYDNAGNLHTVTSARVTVAHATISPQVVTGFEHRTLVAGAGNGLFASVNGTTTISTTTYRSGSASLQVAPAGAAANASIAGDGAGTSGSFRFAVRLATPPASDATIASITTPAGVSWADIGYKQATGELQLTLDGVSQPWTLGAIDTSTWYVFEIGGRTNSPVDMLWWSVDGIQQPNMSSSLQSMMSVDYLRLGSTVATTYTAYFDDVLTTGSYLDLPLGNGTVLNASPNGVGTHVTPGSFNLCTPLCNTILAGDFTSPGQLNEVPLNVTTGWVEQATSGTGAYLEYNIADTLATTAPRAVTVVTQVRASGTANDQICAKITDNAVATVDVYANCSSAPPTIGSTTSLYWRGSSGTKPSGGAWTIGAWRSLRLRWGFSGDINPRPQMDAFISEADFISDYPVPVTNNAPSTPVHVTPADGSTTASTTPTLTATFSDPDGSDTGTIAFEVCTVAMAAGQTCAAAGGTTLSSGNSAAGIANGANGSWTSGALTTGTRYWHARATDSNTATSGWSASWTLIIGTPTMTLSVDSPTRSLDTSLGGVDATGTTTATITTNNWSGYALTATDPSDTWGMNQPAVDTIPDWTGTPATPTAWPAGTAGWFGVNVVSATGGKDTARWGTNTTPNDFVTSLWAGLRTTATNLHQRSTYNPAPDIVVVAYRLDSSAASKPGPYSSTVTYTAVANP